jgi:hypothetical protein
MWVWMRDNPTKSEKDYLPAKKAMLHCFACQYDDEQSQDYCREKCILKWRSGECGYGEYGDWEVAYDTKDYAAAARAADSIVKLCDNALAELDKEEKKNG